MKNLREFRKREFGFLTTQWREKWRWKMKWNVRWKINERISKNKAQHYHPKKRNGTNSSPSRNFQGRILRDSFNYQAPSQTEAELRNKCSLYGKRQEMPPAQPTTKPRRHSRGAKAVRSTIMMQTSTNSSESAPSGTGVFRPQLHLITQRK